MRMTALQSGLARKARSNVSEQHQSQPFENASNVPIRGPEQKRDDQDRINRCPDHELMPVTISVASAIPPRSAPMLMMLEKSKSPHEIQRTHRG